MNFRKWIIRISLGIILSPLVMLAFIYCNYQMISLLVEKRIYSVPGEVPNRPWILVPGAGNYKPELWTNHTLNHRIYSTVELFKKNSSAKILVSGMKRSPDDDETGDMKFMLTNLNIPGDHVIADSAADRTWTSLQRAAEKFAIDSLVIVTQREQLERAVFIADCLGINAVGYVAEKAPRRHRYWTYREYLARVKCIMDCVSYKLNLQ